MKKLINLLLLIPTIAFSQDLFYGDDLILLDTITFETFESNVYLDTSNSNIWQIGIPQKTIFNSGYFSQKAIVSDLVNSYPINNHSFFDVILSKEVYNNIENYASYVTFKHKINSDTLKDGGYITVSHDGGVSWLNIAYDTINSNQGLDGTPSNSNVNLYSINDKLFNNELGFSGNSNWMTTEFSWHVYPVRSENYSDSIILRFNFISDSINNSKEGWMIDDITVYYLNLKGAISDNIKEPFNIYPNPISDNLTISFAEKHNLVNVKIFNQIGKQVFNKKFNNSIKIPIEIDLNSGVYNLIIDLENNHSYSKILILK